MKKILLFLVLATLSFSANLLTHNIYEREDRVDIMLSFDSPYEGQIFQERAAGSITLTLSDLSYNKLIKKNINSNIIQKLTIQLDKNSLKIILKSKNNINVIASKTTDGFGLRIRVKLIKNTPNKMKNSISQTTNNSNNIPTFQDSSLIDTRYVLVVGFLFFLLLIMFWVRKRIANKDNFTGENSWLFKTNALAGQNIKIIHKKPIDTKNSVVLIEFGNKKYLVMSGNSNVLIDTFGEKDLENSSEFEKAFEDNRKKLDDYLKLQDQKLEDYKDKASNEHPVEFR